MVLEIGSKRATRELFATLVLDERDNLMIEHFLMFNNRKAVNYNDATSDNTYTTPINLEDAVQTRQNCKANKIKMFYDVYFYNRHDSNFLWLKSISQSYQSIYLLF